MVSAPASDTMKYMCKIRDEKFWSLQQNFESFVLTVIEWTGGKFSGTSGIEIVTGATRWSFTLSYGSEGYLIIAVNDPTLPIRPRFALWILGSQ